MRFMNRSAIHPDRVNRISQIANFEPRDPGCCGILKLPQFAVAMLCLGLAGCASERIAEPLGNGYEQVAHPTRASLNAPETTRLSLEYRQPDGRIILVWPSLYGVNEVIKGDLVIFVGDLAYLHPDADDPRGSKPRLFAVRAPALPLDITDAVLQRWAKVSGKNVALAAQMLSLVIPAEKDGRLELHLVFAADEKDWPDAVVQADWNLVSEIMRDVKEKGAVHKDARWGTRYMEKEIQPDVEK